MNVLLKHEKSELDSKREFRNWSSKILQNAYDILKHSFSKIDESVKRKKKRKEKEILI